MDELQRGWVQAIFKRFPSVRRMTAQFYALVPGRLRLGRDFWVWLSFMEASEQWSLEQMKEYQLIQLRKLLLSLKQTSPYYANLLAEVNVSRIDDLETFKKQVPALQREVVHDKFDQILSVNWRKSKLLKCNTSGTTGRALQFYHQSSDSAREWAAICHQWRRVSFDPLISKRAEFRGLTISASGVDVFPDLNMLRCSILNYDRPHLTYFADQIKQADASYFHGYPSALYLLARRIEDYGVAFPQPKGILLASEMVYTWQLETLRDVFPKAQLYAHYGCAERTVLAGWCEKSKSYHVLPQYSIVEIHPETNEIIGTNLFNNVNGFLRYRMTDVALESSGELCSSCRRPYIPMIKSIGGRKEDFLFSIDHGWVPPALITFPLKNLKNIFEIQFHQVKPEEITIHFTANKEKEPGSIESDKYHILRGMMKLFGASTNFRFIQVKTFPRSKSGKFKWVVSELVQPHGDRDELMIDDI